MTFIENLTLTQVFFNRYILFICGVLGLIDILSPSAFCKTRTYTTHIFLTMSRSSVALACIDRFALCSPNVYIRRLNQRRKAIILVIAASVLWLIVPIHVIIYNDIQVPE